MIYLYIKTHNVTGLKYLGKTINKDPHSYKGSGKVWKRHIKKHGYDVTTKILYATDNPEDFSKVSLHFSEKYDIVNSKEFANLIPETGDGGIPTWSKESRKKLSENLKSRNFCPNPGYNTEEQRLKISQSMQLYLSNESNKKEHLTKLHSEANRKKAAKTMSELKWCNDGVRNYRLKEIPVGLYSGRLK